MSRKKGLESDPVEEMNIEGIGTLRRGMRVTHPHFGRGEVKELRVFKLTGKNMVGVEFDTVGYKPLAPEFAKLQLVT